MPNTDDNTNEIKINAQIKRVSEQLRKERELLRISQMDLSFKAGLSQNQVNYIETGKRTPNLYTILKICSVLRISPARLFEPENKEREEARDTVLDLVARFM